MRGSLSSLTLHCPPEFSHSTELRGGVWPHSSQASRRAPLAIEEPLLGGDVPSLDFHPARPGMLRTTLRRPQGVPGREPGAPRLWTAPWLGRPWPRRPWRRERGERVAQAVPPARAWPPRPPTVGRAVPALGQPPPGPETRAPAGMRRVGPRARRGDRPPPGPPRGSPEAR